MMTYILKIITPNVTNPDGNMENDEYEENCEPSPELLRLVEYGTREVKPHQVKRLKYFLSEY